jgi:hypothetical protein
MWVNVSDTVAPLINIIYPVNNTNYAINISIINYTVTDFSPDLCWYSNNSGVWNSATVTAGTNFTGLMSKEGWNNWTVYCNDTTTNIGSKYIAFFKDITPPVFANTLNQTLEYLTALSYDINATDENSISCFAVNDTIRFKINCSGNLENNTLLAVNPYWLNITVNDTFNNSNYTLLVIDIVDTTKPNVSLNNPSASYINDSTNLTNVTFNCSATDNYALANISLYITDSSGLNFAINQTTNITGTSNASNWTLTLPTGNYTWNCAAYDYYGNRNESNSNRTIIIYDLQVNVSFTPPTPTAGDMITQTYLRVNGSFSGVNATVNLYNSSRLLINSTTFYSSPFYIEIGNLVRDVYYLNATARSISRTNSTITRNILVSPNGNGLNTLRSIKISDGLAGFNPINLTSYDWFGSAVANIGDLDGDGVQDLAVGAMYDEVSNSSEGAIYILFLNSSGGVKSHVKISTGLAGFNPDGLESDDAFGASIANMGDIDGDGVVDLAVGAIRDEGTGVTRSYSGAVYILFLNSSGGVKSNVKLANGYGGLSSTAVSYADQFGISVANIGDFDGDGFVDLGVGVQQYTSTSTNQGAAYIIFLNSSGEVRPGSSIYVITQQGGGFVPQPPLDSGDNFGSSIANLGDPNGDGVQELAIGAMNDENTTDGWINDEEGAVYIISINKSGMVTNYVKITDGLNGFNPTGLYTNDNFGVSVANIGDLNFDGVDDLAVGAERDDNPLDTSGTGAVYILYMNSTGGVKSHVKISKNLNGLTENLSGAGDFGHSIANLGDIDRDGIQDLAVGASWDSTENTTGEGAVYILSLGVEQIPPVLNIISPSNNTFVNGNITLTVTAVDNIEMRNVLFEYSNSTLNYTTLCNATSAVSTYTCSWPTDNSSLYSNLAEGYNLKITAFDLNSNNVSKIIHLTIDRSAPQFNNLSIIYPSGQTAIRRGQQLILKANVSDSGAGINLTRVDLKNLNSSRNSTMIFESGNTTFGNWSVWNMSVTVNSTSTGYFSASVYLFDIAFTTNNLNQSLFNVSIDNQAPTFLPLLNQTVRYGRAFGYDINATDNNNVSCFGVNNTVKFRINCSGYLENKTALSAGVYWINITLNDTTGNNNSVLMWVNITGCGQTLTSQIDLFDNLTSNGTCFTIGADNLVINGNGYAIIGGDTGIGINVSTYNNITVTNIILTNFTTPVSVSNGYATLINTTVNRSILNITSGGTGNITVKWFMDAIVKEWGYSYFEGYSGTTGYCGDSKCGSGETIYTCSQDCRTTEGGGGGGSQDWICGNHFCGFNETVTNCPADCGGGAGYCGNSICDQGETHFNCSSDCSEGGGGSCQQNATCTGLTHDQCILRPGCSWPAGSCVYTGPSCGTLIQVECNANSPACKWVTAGYCGNGLCSEGETQYTCPVDCAGENYCGNSVCDLGAGETTYNCARDCGQPAPPGVSNVTVSVYDLFGNTVYSGVTGSNGSISRLEVTEFIQNSSGKTTYTIHNITFFKQGYKKVFREINLTATNSISIETVLTMPFLNCEQFNGNQTTCIAAQCRWENDTNLCKPNSTALDCDQFCWKCTAQPACTASFRGCVWDSTGSFCRENFSSFTYGSGGSTTSYGYYNFTPVDCRSNPSGCDSRYDVDKGYFKFETMCFDGLDNDADGQVDCNDMDCSRYTLCSNYYNSSNDTTAPKIANYRVETDRLSAEITWLTTEPTNGTIEFYGTNSNCNGLAINASEQNIPDCALDDYMINHHISLENSTQFLISQNTRYYYKIVGYDQAGLRYQTACLNFTTRSASQNYSMRFSSDPTYSVKIYTGAEFTSYNFSTGSQQFTRYKDARMQFEGAGFNGGAVALGGVDMAVASSINFTDSFRSGTTGNFRSRFVGINSSTWLETMQSLGISGTDNITLTLESRGNRIYKCDDNGENCVQMTQCINIVSSNSTHTIFNVLAAAGFSSYTISDNSQLQIWDQTDSNISLYDADGDIIYYGQNVTFYANYTNKTSGVSITGIPCQIRFNISSNWTEYTNMSYNNSVSLYTHSRSFTSPANYSWQTDCNGSASGFDELNTTDIVIITNDTTAPNITLMEPAANYWNDSSSPVNITFNCSATDNHAMVNISLYITNSTNQSFALNQTINITGTSNASNWTLGLLAGNYTWDCLGYDVSGNFNWSAGNRTLKINYSEATVNVNIIYPDNANYTSNISALNYTVTAGGIPAKCWYSNNSGAWNSTTVTAGNNFTGVVSVEGWNNWTVYCNDTVTNLGRDSVLFFKDTTPPTFDNLTNQSTAYKTNVRYDANATDISAIDCFTINDTTNFNINCSGYLINNTLLGVAMYWLNMSVNDSLGNTRYALMWINITDSTAPNVTLNAPDANYFNDTSSVVNITFNCSAADNYALASINLYLTNSMNNSFALNQTTTVTGTSNTSSWTMILANGTYTWDCLAQDSVGNTNWSSNRRSLFMNFTDFDNDGVTDEEDYLEGNESNVNATGFIALNITIGGNSTNGTYTSVQEVVFYESTTKILNFTHNFSASELNLSDIVIIKATNYVLVNLSGQLQANQNKTIYISDNNFASLCVKDADITSIDNVTSGCNGENETDFTSCLSNSATINGITCTDEGTTIVFENLRHSAVIGTPASSSEASGGGGGRRSVVQETAEAETPKSLPEEKISEKTTEKSSESSYECSVNSDCGKDESCWSHKCTKWFDIEILDFESSIKPGESFNFTYFLKSMAEIKGDVEIKFWIEQDSNIISTGQDTVYFGSFEEKTKTDSLLLPENISSGSYLFHVTVTHGAYTAKAHRTIEIMVEGGIAAIKTQPEPRPYVFYVLIGFNVLIALLAVAGLIVFGRKVGSRRGRK